MQIKAGRLGVLHRWHWSGISVARVIALMNFGLLQCAQV